MKSFYIVLFLFISLHGMSQGRIKGSLIDGDTKEPLIGATLLIQGSNMGAITDLDGAFQINNVNPGTYNIVIRLISYDQKIIRVTLNGTSDYVITESLKPSGIELTTVNVVGMKRVDTESSMLNTIKASTLTTTGISSQQISKSLDRDAVEVIRRVPGITINDGRFIIVRGLIERYNTVWLNGSPAPSMESDIRSFSFDILPSSIIENIVINKSPAPELPADFSGGAINVFTKNNAYDNNITFSYNTGFNSQSTFNDFKTYEGSKTDWLGYDKTTRIIPAEYPTTEEFEKIKDFSNKTMEEIYRDTAVRSQLGKHFNKTWSPITKKAMPDQSFSLGLTRRFIIGKLSVGNISSINYSKSSSHNSYFRAGYDNWEYIKDPSTGEIISDTAKPFYNYYDERYAENVKVGLSHNWSFIFGNNQRIEFRNLFNQIGQSVTTIREGYYYDVTINRPAHELAYQSRAIYSGQLSGTHNFLNESMKVNWVGGYGYANKSTPDIRRVEYSEDPSANNRQYVQVPTSHANPEELSRFFTNNDEHILSWATNIEQQLTIKTFKPTIKTGIYVESKDRVFTTRNIGFVRSFGSLGNTVNQSIDSLMRDQNIKAWDGLWIDEYTKKSDSYTASNDLLAAYLGLNIPINNFNIYGGVRMEKNHRQLNGYTPGTEDSVRIENDTINFFPSVNISYKFTENLLIRTAYGVTINRPEFREISPYSYYNFEEKYYQHGETTLKDAYIHNYDLRLEWYPSPTEMISIGGFYKNFINPIEATLIFAGTGWIYKFENIEKAESYGAELDLRKSLMTLDESDNFLRYFKDFTLVLNTSLIKSVVVDNKTNQLLVTKRPMQGQSPYIVNAGLYYQNDSIGLSVNLMYNVIGERIMFVGNATYPNGYEAPRNVIDLSISQRIGKYLSVKGGVKDILNQKYRFFEKESISVDGVNQERIQTTRLYSTGRLVYIGFQIKF